MIHLPYRIKIHLYSARVMKDQKVEQKYCIKQQNRDHFK